ncbi:hypothetical protein AB4Z09_28680, partial [Rhodococcus sp. TAF43]|uniref:hypothetical protein n=1 Tax=Rhodococcus sp. TAF43 TaxID=3237483 RepID=UPI003F9C5E60
MSFIGIAALLALAALAIWVFGAFLGRIGGGLLVITSLVSIATGGSVFDSVVLLVVGIVLWLAGHLLASYKTGYWRSRLAEGIVARTPLRLIDPVYGREYRELHRAERAAAREGRERRANGPAAPVDHFAAWEREMTDDAAPADPAPAKAPARRPARKPAPAKPAGPSRGVV